MFNNNKLKTIKQTKSKWISKVKKINLNNINNSSIDTMSTNKINFNFNNSILTNKSTTKTFIQTNKKNKSKLPSHSIKWNHNCRQYWNHKFPNRSKPLSEPKWKKYLNKRLHLWLRIRYDRVLRLKSLI